MYNDRYVARGLYQLKKVLGSRIEIHFPTAKPVYNPTDGSVARAEDFFVVKKAIPLDQSNHRKFAYDLSYILGSKEFTQGGFYDHNARDFWCDDKDLQQSPQVGWRVKYGDRTYNIDKVVNVPEAKATMLRCVFTDLSRKAGV